ncbi:unnamed protein product [Caenorhabditis auriculariae]|uniref:ShKT domain-containing protein n=1 Tax=Caenorhabditis auriculariae TaxID=2777116 RepID=A0A8S1HSG2_9PELO|nr:unnamed protein product [Caenorhabditis auriculariae]
MFRLVLLVSFLSSAAAQSCSIDDAIAPCIAGLPCPGGSVCDLAGENCCPEDALLTTAAGSLTTQATITNADGSTVTVNGVTAVTSRTVTTSTCVDRVNPSTGRSDCAAMAYLCNDSTYFSLMTVQCPRTCGRCSTTSTSTGTCVDRVNPSTGVSDCPARAALCNDATYSTLMTVQCPRTCGRCNSTSSSTTRSSTSCVDKVNPRTGVSDCAARAALCTNSVYRTLMTEQCPRTCGFCSTTGSTVAGTLSSTISSTTCVDRVNAATGVSECPQNRALCTRTGYVEFMRTQCPLTCGVCSG